MVTARSDRCIGWRSPSSIKSLLPRIVIDVEFDSADYDEHFRIGSERRGESCVVDSSIRPFRVARISKRCAYGGNTRYRRCGVRNGCVARTAVAIVRCPSLNIRGEQRTAGSIGNFSHSKKAVWEKQPVATLPRHRIKDKPWTIVEPIASWDQFWPNQSIGWPRIANQGALNIAWT